MVLYRRDDPHNYAYDTNLNRWVGILKCIECEGQLLCGILESTTSAFLSMTAKSWCVRSAACSFHRGRTASSRDGSMHV